MRRRLHLIFSKLGVVSRIQAGIYAAQLGLPAPDAVRLPVVKPTGARQPVDAVTKEVGPSVPGG